MEENGEGATSMDTKEKFKWRKQDYFWLIALIIVLWYMTVTVRLSDNSDVVNVISLIASGVSVALAIIAIWWGQVNNSETNKIYDKMNDKIDTVHYETGAITCKLEAILDEMNKAIDDEGIADSVKTSLKNKLNTVIEEETSTALPFKAILMETKKCEKEVYNILNRDLQENENIYLPKKNYENYDFILEDERKLIAINVKYQIAIPGEREICRALPDVRFIEASKDKYGVAIFVGTININIVVGNERTLRTRILGNTNLYHVKLKETIYEMISEC